MDHLNEKYGSVVSFIRSQLGMSEADLKQLNDLYLE